MIFFQGARVVAFNYEKICEENRLRYGTVGAQKSGGLAANLYDDRTHFIFEILQNTEDALARRGEWEGERRVSFKLTQDKLTVTHSGKPFDENDVRSVCDIDESTKDESAIGRFGLGFKSVYAITDCPEIHSGDEDFSINEYVFPKKTHRTRRDPDQTQIILPLRAEDPDVGQDITEGFRRLGPCALLFLRNIEEINWEVEGGSSGFYRRTPSDELGLNVRRINLVGHESGQDDADQNWLVFHRDVFSDGQKPAGRAEIAFSLTAKNGSGRMKLKALPTSPLVAFFPTVIETNLGFLVQGPFRTTTSRDNIRLSDPWNRHLVTETCTLLGEAMRWLRDNRMLDVSVLRCLPLDNEKFPPDSRFRPMFEAVRKMLQEEPLLPTSDDGYVAASEGKLARTKYLRDLLEPKQIEALFGSEIKAWLSGDITQGKAADIRQYLMHELGIEEIRPDDMLRYLTKEFLEDQPDDWVARLYEFLSRHDAAIHLYQDTVPFIRLDDGSHVIACENGRAKVFLPGTADTSFPTVRRAVCETAEARQFLTSLGITEPNPADDVIRNILPKYQQKEVDVDYDAYAADIKRIRAAFNTDSAPQKEKLCKELRNTNFVMVVDMGDGKSHIVKPTDAYIATDRLQQLFSGVPDVFIVDNEYDCLRGEGIRDLLVSCGASRYLVEEPAESGREDSEWEKIRREAGLERSRWHTPPDEFTLRGLPQLLEYLPKLNSDEGAARANVLWEALSDLAGRRPVAFQGLYSWGYHDEEKTAQFDTWFVLELNRANWIPKNGELVAPGSVLFDDLGWTPNPFLQSKIAFKPPMLDQLAIEAGIDPAMLYLLRLHGITNAADLTSRLGIVDSLSDSDPSATLESDNVTLPGDDVHSEDLPDIPPGTLDPDDGCDVGIDADGGRSTSGKGHSGGNGQSNGGGNSRGNSKRTSVPAGGRSFISYVATHPNEHKPDLDGFDQDKRLQIEARAIDLILASEPTLRRMPKGNLGFDLYEADSSGNQVRWVEVKSMTGAWQDHPVGMSRTQFNLALEKGDAYWLYIVENAVDPEQARVLRIQNPAMKARTFTFDHGWSEIAIIDPPG